MNHPNWTADEIALAANSEITAREVAELTGRSYAAVKTRRQVLHRIGTPVITAPQAAPPATYEDDVVSTGGDHWKDEYAKLSAKYTRALKENALVDRLVAEISGIAPRSYDTAPACRKLKKSGGGAAQSAVLLFSDTHVGQVISTDQTLGFGGYNFEIFLARLKFLEDRVISILDEHITTEVPELVIAMLGDMLHGALQHSVEAGQVNTLFAQFYGAGHAIAQFLRNIAAHIPRIRIYTTVGNHTRWGHQHKMPADNRYSNLDTFLYAYLAALTADIKNITWNIDKQPFAIFDVNGFVFHAMHGDTLRGGDKALGIPNHSIARNISVTTQLCNKFGVSAPNYYLVGHLHRSISIPHATGSVIVNGGWPGLDGYALAANFNPVDPTQKLFLVHEKYGKTADFDIALKFAEIADEKPYNVPSEFGIL